MRLGSDRDGGKARRRLIAWFALTTVVPAVGLTWLGWQMVEQDRVLERQREQERREQAADLAAAALQRILAELGESLRGGGHGDPRAAIAVLSPEGLVSRGGLGLPYYPLPTAAAPFREGFAAADVAEFRDSRFAEAIGILAPLVEAKEPEVRAEALVRLARLQRKAGGTKQALEALERLGALGQVAAGGIPAGIAAQQARALLLESGGDKQNLQRVAVQLAADLGEGRWPVTRAVYEMSAAQTLRWGAGPAAGSERLAAAAALDALWLEWRSGGGGRDAPGRRTIWAGGEPVLALWHASGLRLLAALIPRSHLESLWAEALRPLSATRGLDFALSDAEGRAVTGNPGAPPSRQSVRTASATRLPWTVHAISRDGSPATAGRTGRGRLLLAAVFLMAVLILGGGYFVARAISREMSVATLQTDFVSAVSHEFRTPITTMRQLSEMLAQGRVSSDSRRAQFHETLLRESNRLHRLVEGLMNFGRMESGAMRFRFEALDPAELVSEVVSEFRHEAEKAGYAVELERAATAPSIRGDRTSLASVVWNLLDNAVKYSPECRTVWVEVGGEASLAIVRVRDRGLGIPREEQAEVFRKFVRGAASKSGAIQGTGIGLAMARQIVEAHGGRISVESRPGEGSEFTVTLPAAE